MKPNFALTLSFDGIGLLHRAPEGWVRVGDVPLDTDDLGGALADLRARADRIDPQGLRAKLVLPNEQIKYLTIATPDVAEDDLPALVAAALDGATPYAVDDLAFDFTRDGDQTHIAAVALETLDEAEAFAVEHQFTPLSFVAIPPAGQFSGEAFFGIAPSALGWLDQTDNLSRDLQPIRVVGEAVVPEVAPESAPSPTPELPPVQAAEPAPEPEPEAPPAPPAPTFATRRSADLAAPLEVPKAPVAAPIVPPAATPDAPGFASIRAERDAPPPSPPKTAKPISPTAPVIDLDDDLPPTLGLTGTAPTTRPAGEVALGAASRLASGASAAASDMANRAGSRIGAFFSRRGGSATPAPSRPARVTRVAATAPVVASTPTPPPPQSERQRLTVFGARKPEKPPAAAMAIGGKPRYLGLILTAILLLFLAGVAAWAAIFSEDGLSRFFGPDDPVPVVAALPEDAMPDTLDLEGTEAELPGTTLASLDPNDISDLSLGEAAGISALPDPDLDADLTPEEAAARYAATGIWQMAPDQPESPGFTNIDGLYTAAIDPAVQASDALALPPVAQMLSDRPVGQQATPAAAGTQFAMDARGLVRATPEGALTPDGVRVIAGRPPVLPASFPTRFAETPTVDAVADARLAAFRPRPRPDDLVQQNERSQLGGLTRSELARFRPRLRPDVPKAEEEADETATEQAVLTSMKPRLRPGNFDRIVKRAEQTPKASPQTPPQVQPEPVQTASAAAAVAPRTVAPKVPSSANVAREATVRNAISLNKMNLIGVFGKPSSRSALVRMPNGRYKKVKVGDTLDGGRVAAITDDELRYTKGGRAVILKMPRG